MCANTNASCNSLMNNMDSRCKQFLVGRGQNQTRFTAGNVGWLRTPDQPRERTLFCQATPQDDDVIGETACFAGRCAHTLKKTEKPVSLGSLVESDLRPSGAMSLLEPSVPQEVESMSSERRLVAVQMHLGSVRIHKCPACALRHHRTAPH